MARPFFPWVGGKEIYKLLKAGYMEDWNYHKTYSGTPQGGIVSPLFANIYLHELDMLRDRQDRRRQGREGRRCSRSGIPAGEIPGCVRFLPA